MTTSFWICAGLTAISTLVSLGFSIAAVMAKDGNSRLDAMYSFSRSLAIAAAGVTPLFYHSRTWLIEAATVAIIFQALDAGIGALKHNRPQTVGPTVIFAANLAALVWFI